MLASGSRADTRLPDKPLRIVLGFSANGGTDAMVRAVAPFLETRLGRHITVENKPGNSGAAAAESLKSGPADGSVLAFMPSTVLALSVASATAGFNAEADLAPITVTGTFKTALAVSVKSGVRTLDDFVAWTRNDDTRRRRLGVALNDTLLQVYVKSMGRQLDAPLQGVAYRGSAPMVSDLLIDRISAGAAGMPSFIEYHRGNRIRMLAVSGTNRSEAAKDVPTVGELGHPNLLASEWYAYYTSPAVPAAIQAEWNRQLRAAIADREISAQLAQGGLLIENSTQEEASARMAMHLKLWRDRMELVGLKPVN